WASRSKGTRHEHPPPEKGGCLAAAGPLLASAPALVGCLGDAKVGAAADALERIGKPGVPHLAEALKSRDRPTRLAVARALGNLGANAGPACTELVALLAERQTRAGAVQVLSRIGKAAVPALIKALDNEDHEVRRAVALALGYIGPNAEEAAGKLKDRSND